MLRRFLAILLVGFLPALTASADELARPRAATISLIRQRPQERVNEYGSATIVPPVTDSAGRKHALAIGCAHMLTDLKAEQQIDAYLYPDTDRQEIIRDVHAIWINPKSDVSVFDIGPNSDLPYVELGDQRDLALGVRLATIGCPGWQDSSGQTRHGTQTLTGAIALMHGSLARQRDGCTIEPRDAEVVLTCLAQHGHSGGGLFRADTEKLYGTLRGSCDQDKTSHFSMPAEVREAYQAAAQRVQQTSDLELACARGKPG
jgi:hypothetical protein